MPGKKPARTFTKKINGEEVTMVAHTEADVVQFVYDGWREVTPAEPARQAAAKKAAPKPGAKADQ
jgi:hypothetical protein